jgi:hypothetical protein
MIRCEWVSLKVSYYSAWHRNRTGWEGILDQVIDPVERPLARATILNRGVDTSADPVRSQVRSSSNSFYMVRDMFPEDWGCWSSLSFARLQSCCERVEEAGVSSRGS